MVKNPTEETQIRSLGQEDPLDEGVATPPLSCLENPHEQRSLAS